MLNNSFRKVCSSALSVTSKLVWIDMEMTGLNPEKDEIMEVACIITNSELEDVHQGFHTVIHVDDVKLNSMNSWCVKQHGKTGLTELCRRSQITISDAEKALLAYIRGNSQPQDTLYLAGNTVYMDRLFLSKYMPEVDKALHYRIVDVTTIKMLCAFWYPQEMNEHKKRLLHRGLDDIRESIDELKFYRDRIFRPIS